MRLMSSVLLTVAALCATACDDPNVVIDPGPDAATEQDGGTTEQDGGATTDAGEPPIDSATPPPDAAPVLDAGPPPSEEFVALYETVIVRACGGENCHAPGTNEDGYFGFAPTLQMPDPATARAVLVDQPTECRYGSDGRTRVVPFDPAASAIMIAGEDGLCGRRHGNVVGDFTAADLAMIETWIAGGAL